MTALTILAVAAFGLATGSFINVIIYRVPRRESIVWPGSHCPDCGHELKWSDNIPLLSYLFLRGRCRYCGRPISGQYPVVEATASLLLIISWSRFGLSARFFAAGFLLLTLLTVAVIDIQRRLIPNRVILPALAVAAIFYPADLLGVADFLPLVGPEGRWLPLIGFLAGGGLLLLLAVARPGGMGGGDIKLAAFMGLFLGWYILIALFIGFLAGALAGVVAMGFFNKGRKDLLPFGPFLSLGALLTVFYGASLFAWYISLTFK